MKKLILMSIISAFLTGTPAFAASGDDFIANLLGQTPTLADGLYTTTAEFTEVIPVAAWVGGVWVEPKKTGTIYLPPGQTLGAYMIDDAEVVLVIPTDPRAKKTEPRVIKVALDSIIDSGLQLVKAGDVQTLVDELPVRTEVVQRGQSQRAKRASYEMRGRAVYKLDGRWQATGCLAYVEKAIGWMLKMSVRGASNFTNVLRTKLGWQRDDCQNPQVGTVASWQGPHTAIWNGRCWAYDKGCGSPGASYGRIKECVRPGSI